MKNRSALLLLFILVFASNSCSAPPPSTTSTQPAATSPAGIDGSIGTVSRELSDVIRTSSGSSPALVESTDPLFTGDDVRINNGGIGLLDFGDNLRLRLFNDSDLNVVAVTEPGIPLVASLFLTRGGFVGELASTGNSVVFNTPNDAEITVTGTDFFVVYDTDQQMATAGKWVGSMQVTSGGETISVEDGYYIDLPAGQPPGPPILNPLGFNEFQEMITQVNDPLAAVERIRPVETTPPNTPSPGAIPFSQAMGPIAPGQTIQGEIAAAGSMNEYTFEVAREESMLVRLVSPNAIQPVFEIRDAAGNTLCTGGEVELIVDTYCPVLSPGAYRLLIGDANADQTGPYSLFLQSLLNPTNSTRLPLASPYVGALTNPGAVNTYEFPGSPGDLVLVRMAAHYQEFQPGYWIYLGDRSQDCTGNTWYWLLDYACPLAEKGIYHLYTRDPFGGGTGRYQLYLLNLNDRRSLTVLLPGQRQRGEIANPAEADAYTFSGKQGEMVTIRILYDSGDLELEARLFRPDGKIICEGFAQEREMVLPCTLDDAGEFRLVIADNSGMHTGSYILWLEPRIDIGG